VKGKHIWAAMLVGPVAYEVKTILDPTRGDTLSETTREVFQVHTKTGALLFLGCWGFLAAWFPAHVVKRPI
jgi:hypothetical protein